MVGGVLRGAGRQELGAVLNLCSYWVSSSGGELEMAHWTAATVTAVLPGGLSASPCPLPLLPLPQGLGLPAAYLLAVKAGWGIKGLWAGLALCTSVQGVVCLVVLARLKWKAEAERAAQSLAKAHGSCGLDANGGGAALGPEDSAAKLYTDDPGLPSAAAVAPALHGSNSSSRDVERQ